MSAIARIGDPVVNGVIIQASGFNVLICGLPSHLLGDLHMVQVGDDVCIGPLTAGSPTVSALGKPMGRVGDPDACGSVIIGGCPTVLSG